MDYQKHLWRADSRHLEMFATMLETSAANMRARARRLAAAEKAKKKTKEDIEKNVAAGRQALTYYLYGIPQDEAIEETAIETGVKPETVAAQMAQAQKAMKNETKQARQILIMTLQKCGLSQMEIADRMNLHQSTVSRTLGRLPKRA